MSFPDRQARLLAPAPAPIQLRLAPSPGPAASNSSYTISTTTFQPTRVFTLAFFAIALVACIVLTMFITLTLVRRRRARLQYLSRSRMSTLSHPRRSVARPAFVERETPRVIPPLIEGVLVMHPNGEEQVAYQTERAKPSLAFETDVVDNSQSRDQPSSSQGSPNNV